MPDSGQLSASSLNTSHVFLSHSAASVPRKETLVHNFILDLSTCSTVRLDYLRHIVGPCPRRRVFDVIVTWHMLGSHNNSITRDPRQQKCSGKTCNAGPFSVSPCDFVSGKPQQACDVTRSLQHSSRSLYEKSIAD